MVISKSEEDRKKLVYLGLICIALLGILIYSPILHAPFVFDDFKSIVNNDKVKNLQSSLKDFPDSTYLANLSFACNYILGGLNPFGYHLTNILVHVLSASLVYYLIILIFRTPLMADSNFSKYFIAFSTSFLFVAHPLQTQAVSYITQRSTSMATLFYLLTLIFYYKARLTKHNSISHGSSEVRTVSPAGHSTVDNKAEGTRTAFFVHIGLSSITAIAAMKSKPIAVTLPIMILLSEFFFFSKAQESQAPVTSLKRILYVVPVLIVILFITLNMLDMTKSLDSIIEKIDALSKETTNISRTDYLFTQFRVIMTYVRLLAYPFNQSLDYTYAVYHSFANPHVFFSFVLILLLIAFALYLFCISSKKNTSLRILSFGILWFFIALSVESSIIPIRDVIFEHRLYLPSFGFFLAAVCVMDYLTKENKIKFVLISGLVILLSLTAHTRNALWKDSQILWEDVLTKFPKNVRALNSLGVILKDKDEFDKAADYFENVLLINNRYAPAYYNLGDIEYRLGQYETAVQYFRKGLSYESGYQTRLDLLTSLAITYSEMGNHENAVGIFKQTVKLYPAHSAPYNNLGRQYIKMGQYDLAIKTLEKALERRESPSVYYNLSVAHKLKGEEQKSKLLYLKALKLEKGRE